METVVFGAGCFWCTEAVFAILKGVKSVEPGYAALGGREVSPPGGVTYEYVSTGTTPYVEVAKIEFNPDELSFEELLQVFFSAHDATQANGQGNDIGTQYRSAIFYTTEQQRDKAEHYIRVLKPTGVKPITTTIEPLRHFWPAEDYHKKYYEAHKDAAYCQLVIAPKVEKVGEKFKNLIQK